MTRIPNYLVTRDDILSTQVLLLQYVYHWFFTDIKILLRHVRNKDKVENISLTDPNRDT